MAALQGKSIKQFVLASTLGADWQTREQTDLNALDALLDQRIKQAKTGEISHQSVEETVKRAIDRADAKPG